MIVPLQQGSIYKDTDLDVALVPSLAPWSVSDRKMELLSMMRELDEVLENVLSGSAIAFLGAGFSSSAKIPDPDNQGSFISLPGSSEAAALLAMHMGITEDVGDAGLADIADIVKDNLEDIEYDRNLSAFFLKYFTCALPSPQQMGIMALPWRSIFTTNYDDVVERASSSTNLQFFSPNSRQLDIAPGKTPVYHLHGRAADLIHPSSLDGFVISETNYLELSRHNKPIYDRLFGDIHAASEVVFIGYSLRDIGIASRLFSIKSVSASVSIVISRESSPMEKKRLEKFGRVYEIGVEGFAAASAAYLANRDGTLQNSPKFLKPLTLQPELKEVTAEDVESLFLTGQFDTNVYFASLLAGEKTGSSVAETYSVHRQAAIDTVLEDIQSGKCRHFLIEADVGNGKSVFLKQLAVQATRRLGIDVYEINTQIQEVHSDVEKIVASGRQAMFLIDGQTRYRKLISFITPRLGPTCSLVVSDPERKDEFSGDATFAEFDQRAKLVDINKLDFNEANQWNDYLERWGLWGDRIEMSHLERSSFISNDCSSENRSLVLSVFKDSSVARRIESLVRAFMANNDENERSLVAILVRALCHQHVQWSHIVAWLRLDEQRIKSRVRESGFLQLTNGSHHWHEITSHELAGYILNNYRLSDEIIVDTYCTIVAETAYLSKDRRNGFDSHENLKELMRFRFLTRLFSGGEKSDILIDAVYHRLSKNSIIREKELFWLQWGMARLDLNDTVRAETYLDNAAGLANKYNKDHSMRQIDDQFARLYFKKASKSGESFNEVQIQKAIATTRTSLQSVSDSPIYPLRTAILIESMVSEKCDDMSRSLVSELIDLLKEMIAAAEPDNVHKSTKGELRKIRVALKRSLLVLQNV
ncbi:MAG: SIR2 family protein [Flavobacteriaceae bacterium]|nr:SIR2 family protein [Flavobacteriaceae bacterium]